jgi:putative ABC transport system permease protein
MRTRPMFVLFVVLTLGFGIGANTTVFTVINTLILNPLPVRNPSELAAVSAADIAGAAKTFPISYPDLKDFETGNGVFQSLAGYTSPRVLTMQSSGASERMFAEIVTGNYFSTLGLAPARGRFFLADEDTAAGAHPVVVINHATWKSRFGASEDIIGRTLVINHAAFTVVGVAPAGFIGLNAIFGPDLWIPAAMAESLLPREMQNVTRDRSKALFTGVGRLNAGTRLAQAQANLGSLASAVAREYPSTHAGHTAVVRPVRDVIFGVVGSAAGGAGPIVLASGALLAVVGIVLLIACSNVANLLLARSASRQTELAVRLAMGASRPRLVRQLLTESLLLGLLSGVLGVFLGYVGLQLLFGALPGAANFATPKLDLTVFLYALVLSLGTGLLFGTIPAVRASRGNVA